MSYTNYPFRGIGDDAQTAAPAPVTRSPWTVLAMFGLLTGMAVYFSKEMDRKTLKKNRRRR